MWGGGVDNSITPKLLSTNLLLGLQDDPWEHLSSSQEQTDSSQLLLVAPWWSKMELQYALYKADEGRHKQTIWD